MASIPRGSRSGWRCGSSSRRWTRATTTSIWWGAGRPPRRDEMSDDIAVLGVGMHPWGKWGHNFVEYGVHAMKAALDDAGLAWTDVQFVAGADTIRNGYPGYVA